MKITIETDNVELAAQLLKVAAGLSSTPAAEQITPAGEDANRQAENGYSAQQDAVNTTTEGSKVEPLSEGEFKERLLSLASAKGAAKLEALMKEQFGVTKMSLLSADQKMNFLEMATAL